MNGILGTSIQPLSSGYTRIATAQYPEPVALYEITDKESVDAIKATKALKAPGPDEIANSALQAGALALAQHLTGKLNSSIASAYCSAHFRYTTTAMLRKPGKDDYKVSKAYQPIALLNTMGKVLDAVVARRPSYVVEMYSVLPSIPMGGRPQKSTDHALHNITNEIY